MLDLFNIPTAQSNADIQVFAGPITITQQVWNKPRGVSMTYMLAIAPGGDGGQGAVGAAGTAAGGGGGGSGGQSTLLIPTIFLPDQLFVYIEPVVGTTICPDSVYAHANNQVLRAISGGNGGNASGGTAGTAGGGGSPATISACRFAGLGKYNFLAGQAGSAGGISSTAGGVSIPTTGLLVTGGTGGGGLPATLPSSVNMGGSITGAGVFPTAWINGSYPSGGTDSPGVPGTNGFQPIPGLPFFYGGTGGTSQSLSATGGAAGGGRGGDGYYGCGGGGGGGGFTGSTAALGGKGGPGLVVIISW